MGHLSPTTYCPLLFMIRINQQYNFINIVYSIPDINITSPDINDYDDDDYNDVELFDPSLDNTFYEDIHNTHDSNVIRSVVRSVAKLLEYPLEVTIEGINQSPELDGKTKEIIKEFCSITEHHTGTDITYETLLLHVWQQIIRSDHRLELIGLLKRHLEECYEEELCFTGIFNHTLSVIAGFVPGICIEISDSSRIGGIIIHTRQQLIEQNSYSPTIHYELSRTKLLNLGYDENTIEPWLKAIIDDV